MQENKKNPLFVIIAGSLVILLAIAGSAAFYFLSLMKPMPTSKITDGLYAVRTTMVSFFILDDGTNAITIDAGLSPEAAAAGVKELGLDAGRIKAVFLTHSDFDHTAGALLFSNAAVYLPELEVSVANGNVPRRLFGRDRTNSIPYPYQVLKTAATNTTAGYTVIAIPTPGHTPGSTSYLVNGRWLFTGDLAIISKDTLAVTWAAFNNDSALSTNSLTKLKSGLAGVELVLTSHSGVWKVK